MKFRIENLGRLDRAELEVADLTVICGENNSGKTYATYALYGFLRMWAQSSMAPHPMALIAANALPQTGVHRIDLLKDLLPTAESYFEEMSKVYNTKLVEVFASREDYFNDSAIHFMPDEIEPDFSAEFKHAVKIGAHTALIFSKEADSAHLEITRPSGLDKAIPPYAVANLIDDVFRQLLWNKMVPSVHISSTERTGAAVFHRSLNFSRDKALGALAQIESKRQQHDSEAFVNQLSLDHRSGYPLPVEDNVKLLGNLEQLSKTTGKIAATHPEILSAFDEIVGGAYKSTKEGVYYIPKGSKNKLTMAEASSVVRSLLDFSFYLRHVLKPGDLLIMDEPEMSLHPKNQRLLTRLLARLVNAGVRIFITTHSDYIIRELNALIVMKSLGDRFSEMRKSLSYDEEELLSAGGVHVYTACDIKEKGAKKALHCLEEREVDPTSGMGIDSFDDQIEKLNELQEMLIQTVIEEETSHAY
jgi:ABC-type multidrug transport system ATPase subunit